MVWFSDLMILNSFLESSGCCSPRRVAIVKRCLGVEVVGVVVLEVAVLERTERDRFLWWKNG